MFLPREKKILNMLLKKEKTFTTAELAAELKVDPRTIKADVKKMNEELKVHSCFIRTKRGVGLWLDSDEEGEAYLKSILREQQSYLMPEARKYQVAAELLNASTGRNLGYISMETLANKYFVSKATILNDVNELEPFWKRFGLTCIKKVKYGMCVEGSERQIRLALFDALGQMSEESEFDIYGKTQAVLCDVDVKQVGEIIKAAEKRFKFVLTDLSFHELLIRIAVLLQRTANDHYLEENEEMEPEPQRKEWFVAEFIRERIEECLGRCLPKLELTGLILCLRGLRFQVPMAKVTSREELKVRSPELFEYMMEVLCQIDEKYVLELETDEELACALFSHLECMFYRVESKMYLVNPILQSLKQEMAYEYEIASYLVSRINSKYGIEAADDEIGYITFHIGTAIERNAQRKKKRISATLVCMSGVGSSQFIAVKLKKYFPDLEIKKIISSNVVSELKKEDQDFVISTIPLVLADIFVIQISLFMNDEDIRKIQQYVQTREKRQMDDGLDYSYLKGFWHEEITILGCDLKSKEEVMEVLGNRMFREGYVDEGFVASVFEREKLSDTASGCLVAIPHAFEGHVLKEGIGLMTLKRPVAWGKDKTAQVVFMLALNANTGTDFQKIFKAVFNLTRNFKDVDKILKATSLAKIKNQYL